METVLEKFFKLQGAGLLEKETKGPAIMVKTRLARVCDLLNRAKAKYLIVGDEACILHGLTRTTEDIDIFVDKDARNIEKILNALSNLPYGIAGEVPSEKAVKVPITIIGDQPRVDILTVFAGISFIDAWTSRKTKTIEGITVPYVSIDKLIKSKETDRLQDLADKETLERIKKNFVSDTI